MNRELVRTIFIICFIATLALGLWIAGTPENARKKNEDLEQAKRLADVSYDIGKYIERRNKLPNSLGEVSFYKDKIKNITYIPDGEKDGIYYCQLCSDFNLKGEPEERTRRSYGYLPYNLRESFYKHDAGHTCFKIGCTKENKNDFVSCVPEGKIYYGSASSK